MASSRLSTRRLRPPTCATSSRTSRMHCSGVTAPAAGVRAPSGARAVSTARAMECRDSRSHDSAAWTEPGRGHVWGSGAGRSPSRILGTDSSASRASSAVFPVPAGPVTASSPWVCDSSQVTRRLSGRTRPEKWWRGGAVGDGSEVVGVQPGFAVRRHRRCPQYDPSLLEVGVVEEPQVQGPDLGGRRAQLHVVQPRCLGAPDLVDFTDRRSPPARRTGCRVA